MILALPLPTMAIIKPQLLIGMKMKMVGIFAAALVMGTLLLTVTGCSSPRVTETGRSAVEQFLLSTVVENGIAHADFTPFKGKKIFIEYEYLAPQVDKPYVQGIFEMHLAKNGLIVTRDAKKAELLVQNGFSENYVDDIYSCGICRDTGFVEGKRCIKLLQPDGIF